MYAARINARYPPNINPIRWVLACNGEKFALTPFDSLTDVLYANAVDLRPGTDILGRLQEQHSIKMGFEIRSPRS